MLKFLHILYWSFLCGKLREKSWKNQGILKFIFCGNSVFVSVPNLVSSEIFLKLNKIINKIF